MINNLLLFGIIYTSADSLIYTSPDLIQADYLVSLNIVFILISLIRSINARKAVNKNNIIAPTILLIFLLASVISRFGNIISLLYQIFILAGGFSLIICMGVRNLLLSYTKLIYILCIASLGLYSVAILTPDLLGLLPGASNSSAISFKSIFLSHIFTDVKTLRNSSIFREPGVFSIYIAVALIIDLYWREDRNNTEVAVKIFALLTTFSSVGYIVLIVLFILDKKINSTKYLFTILIATILLVGLWQVERVLGIDIYSTVFSKFDENSLSYGSTLSRLASVTVNWEMFLTNPFIGVGIENYKNLFELISFRQYGVPLNSESQSTNTFMSILAIYGIFVLSSFMLILFRSAQILGTKMSINFVILISLLLMLSSQDMRYSFLFSLLIGLGMSYQGNSRLSYKRNFKLHISNPKVISN